MSTDVISSGLNSGDCNLDEMCCWSSRIRVSLRVPLFSRVFPFSDLTHRSFLLSLLILFHTSLPSSLFLVFSPRLYSAFAQVYYDKLSFISPTLSLFLYCRSHLFLFATLSSQRLSLFLFSFPPHCLSFFKTMLFLSRSIFSSYFSTAFPFSLLSSLFLMRRSLSSCEATKLGLWPSAAAENQYLLNSDVLTAVPLGLLCTSFASLLSRALIGRRALVSVSGAVSGLFLSFLM